MCPDEDGGLQEQGIVEEDVVREERLSSDDYSPDSCFFVRLVDSGAHCNSLV